MGLFFNACKSIPKILSKPSNAERRTRNTEHGMLFYQSFKLLKRYSINCDFFIPLILN